MKKLILVLLIVCVAAGAVIGYASSDSRLPVSNVPASDTIVTESAAAPTDAAVSCSALPRFPSPQLCRKRKTKRQSSPICRPLYRMSRPYSRDD